MATANPVTIEASFEQNSVPDPNTLGIDFTANSTPHPSANFVYFSGLFGTQKFGVSTNDKVKNWTAGIDEFNYNGIPKTTRVLVSGVWTVVPVWRPRRYGGFQAGPDDRSPSLALHPGRG